MNLNPKPERQGTLRAIPKRRIITRRRENGLSYPSWPGLSKHTTCNLGCGSALTSGDQSINQSTRISHLNYEIITRCQARYLNCILHHVPNPKKIWGKRFHYSINWRNSSGETKKESEALSKGSSALGTSGRVCTAGGGLLQSWRVPKVRGAAELRQKFRRHARVGLLAGLLNARRNVSKETVG